MLILDGHTSPVATLAFSPDSYWLASGTQDGKVRCWDAAGCAVHDVGLNSPCHSVAFAPSGDRLVCAQADEFAEMTLAELPGLSSWWRVGRVTAPFSAAAYLDGQTLIVGSGPRDRAGPGSFALWSVSDRRQRQPIFTEPHGVRSVAAHPPTRRVTWTNGSRRATVWDITKPDPVHFNLTHVSPAVAFHSDGGRIAVAQEWGATVFEVARKREVAAMKGHKGRVTSVAFGPDGQTLATGSWDGTVRLWNPDTGGERQVFASPVGRVLALAYAPDGTRLAAGGDSGGIAVWDLE